MVNLKNTVRYLVEAAALRISTLWPTSVLLMHSTDMLVCGDPHGTHGGAGEDQSILLSQAGAFCSMFLEVGQQNAF